MNFLWIAAGAAPSCFLLLIFLLKKKSNNKARLFKDFWIITISWVIAGIAALVTSFLSSDVSNAAIVFFAFGFMLNISGTFIIVEKNMNRNKKSSKK